ncbi:EXC6B protein, partial [Polyodon spathula]|nr:EXC6B protein [Polyodon spathula]
MICQIGPVPGFQGGHFVVGLHIDLRQEEGEGGGLGLGLRRRTLRAAVLETGNDIERPYSTETLTMQPPQSYSVGGQRSSGQLTGTAELAGLGEVWLEGVSTNTALYLSYTSDSTVSYLIPVLYFIERMKDTSRKNNMFAQFCKNERDKHKLVDTVVKQLRSLINAHH